MNGRRLPRRKSNRTGLRSRPTRMALTLMITVLAAEESRSSDHGQTQRASTTKIAQKIDEYVVPLVEARDFSGAILVARDGKVIFRKAYGMANYELGVKNTTDTKFGIASISKYLTAVAVMRLVQQDRLQLDDRLSKYLPDFPGAEGITIAQVLGHRAGIPHASYSLENDRELMTPIGSASLVRRIGAKPRVGPPGKQRQYSTAGYSVLGRVIEIATGQAYEDAMRQLVFLPSGMHDTGDFAGRKLILNRASGYEPAQAGGIENARRIAMENKLAGGSLYSTVEDLHRLHRAIVTDKLLKPKLREEIVKRGYGGARLVNGPYKLYGSNGGIDGYISFFDQYLDQDLCVVMLCNIHSGVREYVRDAVLSIPLGLEYGKTKTRSAYPTPKNERLADYTGSFRLNPRVTWTVVRHGGSLAITSPGHILMPLDPVADDKFFLRHEYATLTFSRDDAGRVHHMSWLEDNGTALEWERVE